MDNPKSHFIKTLYLYLVSFVALMMLVISATDLIQIVLKAYIFTKADVNVYGYAPACPTVPAPTDTSTPTKPFDGCLSKADQEKQDAANRDAQRQRDVVRDISMLLVASPLFYFHWLLARRKE